MQPIHSNLIAYLASNRAGSVGRTSENGRTIALNTNSTSGWNEASTATGNSAINRMMDPQRQVSATVHESELIRALLSHPGNTGSTIHNQSRRTEMMTAGTIPTVPSGISAGTSDEELYHAQQRTSALLSQYYNRQNQLEQREKVLLEQRLPTALGSSNHLDSRSIIQQLQLEQQARQQLSLSSSLSNNSSILEVLRQSNEGRQQDLLFQDLHGLQRLLSPPPAHHAGLDLLNQLRQIDAQNDLQARLMNLSGSSSAHRELNATNPMLNGFSPLLSNCDRMTQTRNLNNLLNHQQSSAVEQMLLQDISTLLSRNTRPAAARNLGQSLAAPETNDKKPAATISLPVHSKIDKKVIHRMGRVGKFPIKLHALLNELKNQGRSDVAAFLPHGNAFGIFNIEEFVKTIMPLHFRMSRYSSFQRQLNLYDFQRITEGPYKGAYHVRMQDNFYLNSSPCLQNLTTCRVEIFLHLQHHLFVEHHPELLQSMKRIKIKGTSGKQQSKNFDHLATAPHKIPSLLQAANRESDDDNDDTDAESENTGS